MSTFVLVPGAGGSPWPWSRVVDQLTLAGHAAIAVDLPGDDPEAGLPEYTELVLRAAATFDDPVLVGGSLGGFTVAMVAARRPVRSIVLVNAMVPSPGETPGDWWANTGAIAARDEAAKQGGYGPFDVATYFLHDLPPDVLAEGEQHQRDEAEAVFASTCDFDDWPDVPIRVLAGADDRFFPLELQRRVAHDRLGLDVDAIPGGHLLPLAQPSLVTEYLLAH